MKYEAVVLPDKLNDLNRFFRGKMRLQRKMPLEHRFPRGPVFVIRHPVMALIEPAMTVLMVSVAAIMVFRMTDGQG